MDTATEDLEKQIRAAFRYRANQLPETRSIIGSAPLSQPKKRTGTRMLLVAAAVVALAVGAVLWSVMGISDSDRAKVTSGGTAATPPGATSTSLPPAIIGDELALTAVATDDTETLMHNLQIRTPAGTNFTVVQTSGSAPVIVYHDATSACMSIAAAPVPAAGYQGACLPQSLAAQTLVGTLDTGPVMLPTTLAYGVWSDVPSGAEYVTFTYGDEHKWQRPVDGVSYFTVPAPPPLDSEPVVLRAFDAQGNELGQATRPPHQDGAGVWTW
jgi:hypothetical protein